MYRHGKHSRHDEHMYIHTRKHYTQHTHTLKENFTEFPTNGEGKFQHKWHFQASTTMLIQPCM